MASPNNLPEPLLEDEPHEPGIPGTSSETNTASVIQKGKDPTLPTRSSRVDLSSPGIQLANGNVPTPADSPGSRVVLQAEVTVAETLSKVKWENMDVEMTTTDEDSESSTSDSDVYVPAAVCKLRALARVVMINLRWAKDIRRAEEFKGFETTHHDEETGHRRSSFFKVADFIASNRVISGLTDDEKEALKLHPFGRKPEDLQLILKIMERYQCFDKFSLDVREKLAIWVRYDTFDDGRVLNMLDEFPQLY